MLSPEHPVPPQHPLKILVAEDNLINQKLTLRQLHLLGYSADAVDDGQAAVDAVMQRHYDLVLMDFQMPILNGLAATVAIRQWEREQFRSRKHNPLIIIALTASNLKGDRERALSSGMDDYLAKPVHKEKLGSLLAHWQSILLTQASFSATSNTTTCPQQLSITSDLLLLPHLDLDHLHCLSDHKPEFELELLKIFIEDHYSHLKVLQQSILHRDFSQVQKTAHYIKGASANVGAKRMQFLAEQIETLHTPHSGSATTELLTELEFSLTQVELCLNRMRKTTCEVAS